MSLADLPHYDFVQPQSLDGLCALMAERATAPPGVVLLAGGTDFLVEIAQGPPRRGPLPLVADVSRMEELRGIEWDGTRLRIGAAATYLEIARHPVVRERAPLLERMTLDVGGPTIQARGTLGGNLATASPAADGVCAIAAYDPVLEVASVRGRRRIPMSSLQTGYKKSTRAADEVFVAIELVPASVGSPWIWRKVGTRLAQAISKVALAAVAEIGPSGVTRFGAAMASVAPVTALMKELRTLVLSRPLAELDRAAVDAAIDADIAPIDDLRSTRAYRAHAAKAVVRAFLRDLGAPV